MLFLLLLIAFTVLFIRAKISYLKRNPLIIDEKRRKYKVTARVKRQEQGRWMCKFFDCGNRIGFFKKKPSKLRVDALIVGYDEKMDCFELEEI